MNLTGHSQDAALRRALPLLERGGFPFWVAIDPDPADAEYAAHTTKLIVRHFFRFDFNEDATRQAMDDADPFDAAIEFCDECARQPWFPFCWAVMTPPAMVTLQSPVKLLGWAIRFQSACVVLLARRGKQCFVCNVPNGQPGFPVPGAVYYCCQEYRWDTDGGLLNYRSWFPSILQDNPDAKLLVAETGRTALLATYPVGVAADAPHGNDVGWQGGYGVQGVPAVQFWQEMLAYDAELEQDPYVMGAAIFGAGTNPDWASFEIIGTEVEGLMQTQAQAQAQAKQVADSGANVDDFARWGHVPTPSETQAQEDAAVPQFKFGFLAKAQELGPNVVGAPLTDEEYLGQNFSYQFTEKGLLVYSRVANQVHFLPAR